MAEGAVEVAGQLGRCRCLRHLRPRPRLPPAAPHLLQHCLEHRRFLQNARWDGRWHRTLTTLTRQARARHTESSEVQVRVPAGPRAHIEPRTCIGRTRLSPCVSN